MAQPAKALIDGPETVVVSAIDALVSSTPHLARLDGYPEVGVGRLGDRSLGEQRTCAVAI